jgi:hypothetical protein
VHIVFPPDNSTLTTQRLDYSIETKNFNLGSNDNYAVVWVDGQRADRILSSGGHALNLSPGIHDLCIALVDGQSNAEVGARAGIRLVVSGAAPQTPTINPPSIALWLIVISSFALLFAAPIVWNRRRHRRAAKL